MHTDIQSDTAIIIFFLHAKIRQSLPTNTKHAIKPNKYEIIKAKNHFSFTSDKIIQAANKNFHEMIHKR